MQAWGAVAAALGRFWRSAPRQLRFTREGRYLVGIALASGFAAINTGHNLLFLGWGLVLSTIVLSGVLSEATLRNVQLLTGGPDEARVGERCALPLRLSNPSRRVPAFGLEIDLQVRSPRGRHDVAGPHVLRLDPGAGLDAKASFVPTRRGLHKVERLRARTAFPFGFFEKSRGLRPRTEVLFWAAPARVDVADLALALLGRAGVEPAHVAGPGEDFFSLRPMRPGDDPRRVQWRRSAKAGRLVVVETEAQSARQVELVLCLGAGAAGDVERLEHGIAVFASLAERLLAEGLRLAVRAPGIRLAPDVGERQRWSVLQALARLDPAEPTPSPGLPGSWLVAVAGPGAVVPSGTQHVVHLPAAGPPARGAA